MDKYKNLQIEDINVWADTYGDFSIIISWECHGKGFGKIYLYKNGDNYTLNDEYMSKEFVMKLFEKLYDMCKSES